MRLLLLPPALHPYPYPSPSRPSEGDPAPSAAVYTAIREGLQATPAATPREGAPALHTLGGLQGCIRGAMQAQLVSLEHATALHEAQGAEEENLAGYLPPRASQATGRAFRVALLRTKCEVWRPLSHTLQATVTLPPLHGRPKGWRGTGASRS